MAYISILSHNLSTYLFDFLLYGYVTQVSDLEFKPFEHTL